MQKVEQKNQGRHNRSAYASGPRIATVIKLQHFIDSIVPLLLADTAGAEIQLFFFTE